MPSSSYIAHSPHAAAPSPEAEERPLDWDRLLALRDSFLDGAAGAKDYWEDEALLEDYDDTFGRRIAWKWDWLLQDLRRLGWTPPAGVAEDWGCGPGVALRTYADYFPVTEACFHDRSRLAAQYASRRLQRDAPAVRLVGAAENPAALLVSHVLTELDDAGLQALQARMEQCQTVLWVEPGMSETSRRMLPVREALLAAGFHVVAPCRHQQACPMALEENARHWCHHFATPPGYVFTDGFWAQFGKTMGVDLRSLPLACLVMDRRPPPPRPAAAPSLEPAADARVIGRCKVFKPYACILACDAAGRLTDAQLTKRRMPAMFRRMRHHEPFSLVAWECSTAGKTPEAVAFEPWE